ncbi:serine/threonine-protein phosphatase 2A regulatory subunit B'' subunit beta-like [Ornithodoros turicata]|uniref:serine/threonine-protein phosphatase 2A regulatory subunit B'' subunit beta-like n=1 Tax=Ornithodoros turicata TaxID=34597 RepID=UPI003138E458
MSDPESHGTEPAATQIQPSTTPKPNQRPVIPLFYFPYGRPLSAVEIDMACRDVRMALNDISGDVLGVEDFITLAHACSLPGCFKTALFAAAGGRKDRPVTKERFCRYYSHLVANFPEENSRAVHVLAPDRDYLVIEDLHSIFVDFFEMHPKMNFLQKTPQFREPYVNVALTKYFFYASRTWKNMLSIRDLRDSQLLPSLRVMEETAELDPSNDVFSFGSFYVTYAIFEGLDRDRDGMLSPEEIKNFQGGAFTNRGLDRILCSAVVKRVNARQMMSLQDFVVFHVVESNKGLPKSVEFWFHCLDFDGDGFITVYDMQYLYEDKRRIVERHFPCCDFTEVAHEIFERVKPKKPQFITVSDLKKCDTSVVCMIVNTFMLVPMTVR